MKEKIKNIKKMDSNKNLSWVLKITKEKASLEGKKPKDDQYAQIVSRLVFVLSVFVRNLANKAKKEECFYYVLNLLKEELFKKK